MEFRSNCKDKTLKFCNSAVQQADVNTGLMQISIQIELKILIWSLMELGGISKTTTSKMPVKFFTYSTSHFAVSLQDLHG